MLYEIPNPAFLEIKKIKFKIVAELEGYKSTSLVADVRPKEEGSMRWPWIILALIILIIIAIILRRKT